MSFILRLASIFVITFKRLFTHLGLTLATVAGLIAAVALIMSIPLYADAVYYRLLYEGALGDQAAASGGPHQPFAFLFRYVGKTSEPKRWEDVLPLDQYLFNNTSSALRLPLKMSLRTFSTDNVRLFAQKDAAYESSRDPLTWTSFGFISDFVKHVDLVEGTLPSPASFDKDSPVEAVIGQEMAEKLGIQPGELYTAFAERESGSSRSPQFPVKVTGIWKPKDPTDPYWIYSPSALGQQLLVAEESFLGRVAQELNDKAYLASWYLLLDSSNLHADDVPRLLRGMADLQQRATTALPGTTLAISPVSALQQYVSASRLLTVLLYAFSVPIVGLLLAFVWLVASLSVRQRRNEFAVLRSRGATTAQVVGMAAVEGLILGLLALAAAWPVSQWITATIGHAASFLDFSRESQLRVSMSMTAWRFGVAAVVMVMLAQIVPAIGAAKFTIVTYKQDRARSLHAPFWQRAYLDVLLLIPVLYGAFLLKQQNSVVMPAIGEIFGNDPFQNPLLFLTPALAVFACTLFMLRLIPLLMRVMAWLLSHIGGIGPLLAARHLARSPGGYSTPLMLLTLTLSLSAFTASLAQTLDMHLYDRNYYRIGADFRIADPGENSSPFTLPATSASGPSTSGDSAITTEGSASSWNFLPVADYLKAPGVLAATRVGRFSAASQLSGNLVSGTYIGVDRADFARSAFWRRDFAPARLGRLMNDLAVKPNGVLLPRSLMQQYALSVGDVINLTVMTAGQRNDVALEVVGAFDLFPTWYPPDGPLFVGNLDYLYDQAGNQFPYEVWLKTQPGVNMEQVAEAVKSLNPQVSNWNYAMEKLSAEQNRPERQGLFGFLSIGFITAALLTVLGFFLYAFFSFRQRFVELGILRAIGLSTFGMILFLAWELAFLIVGGLAAGTLLGIWSSNLFIPYLQVGAEVTARIPPYVVEIAWPAIIRIWMLFGLLFVVALTALAALLIRMRIFQAVKLGETV
jgi:putative ABC transport system permease protein